MSGGADRATEGEPGRGRTETRDGRPMRPRRRSRHGGRGGSFLAALDLGTNNCRLLIAKANPGGFRVVDAFSRIVRLGEGVNSTGCLSETAMRRTIDALKVCSGKMRRWRVARTRSVATEACRRAANCKDFLEQVRKETGIEIEIISAREEATLALAGCAPLLDTARPHAIVFDIGGGSTEISWLKLTAAGSGPAPVPQTWQLVDWVSMPLGVVSLTENHGGDRIGLPTYEQMVSEVLDHIAAFESRHAIADRIRRDEVQMLGTSGTVTTLAGVHLDLPRYSRSRVDGSTLAFPDLTAISLRLAQLDYAARAELPCIGPERADLVVSGCAILEAIRRAWPVASLRVADRGLREGILLGLNGVTGPVDLGVHGSEPGPTAAGTRDAVVATPQTA